MIAMSTATETLTIQLPVAAARRLRHVAEIARRPVDEVIAETLHASLPPLLEDLPPALREGLADLEALSTTDLWQQLYAEFDPERLARYDDLLAANAAGTLNETEQRELALLRAEADHLMFRRAYAALLLKWRGERVPTLAELETAP
jgi:hypothetical protein